MGFIVPISSAYTFVGLSGGGSSFIALPTSREDNGIIVCPPIEGIIYSKLPEVSDIFVEDACGNVKMVDSGVSRVEVMNAFKAERELYLMKCNPLVRPLWRRMPTFSNK